VILSHDANTVDDERPPQADTMPMHVAVTGATGFIGGHLVGALLSQGHRVTAIARNEARFREMPWSDQVKFVAADIGTEIPECVAGVGEVDALVHLAWPGLPNYRDLFHLEENLAASYTFIKSFVDSGCPQVLVTGTCFEYGMQQGRLSESAATVPANPYGVAKDSLRRHLEMLKSHIGFRLQWARLFYMFGDGQNPKSLLAQLDSAIDRGDHVFNMSGGEQLRDYLPVSQVAGYLAMIIRSRDFGGIVNVCSGQPISVRRLVEQHIRRRGATIDLNLGHYPYPDYEPFAFWGDNSVLRSIERYQ
tara:strand:- start:81896 stop:82810 length:915 start_codon:yes stop_codon:yes gene_type:complete